MWGIIGVEWHRSEGRGGWGCGEASGHMGPCLAICVGLVGGPDVGLSKDLLTLKAGVERQGTRAGGRVLAKQKQIERWHGGCALCSVVWRWWGR